MNNNKDCRVGQLTKDLEDKRSEDLEDKRSKDLEDRNHFGDDYLVSHWYHFGWSQVRWPRECEYNVIITIIVIITIHVIFLTYK